VDMQGAGKCFNPRPRRGAGATDKRLLLELIRGVSILARAEARALPKYQIPPSEQQHVSILARAEARALQF